MPRHGSFLLKLALSLCLGLIPILALAQPTPAPAPLNPSEEDFGHYLASHQEDVTPVISKNRRELLREAVPVVIQWMGRFFLFSLAAEWGIDVLLGRGFAALFAPSVGTFRPALLYATGRFVLSFFVLTFFGGTLILVSGFAHLEAILIVLVILFVFAGTALQVYWIQYLYRAEISIAVLFYLTLVVVHGFLTLAILPFMVGAHANYSARAFMDTTATAKVLDEAAAVHQELAAIAPARDKVKEAATRLQDRIDQATAEQAEIQKQIEATKNSEGYLYNKIVKVHAAGDLVAARDQFAALLARFPNNPMNGMVKGQLVQVTSEIAAQDAGKKQAEATRLRNETHAQADLLARAKQGRATLSEMRRLLMGKTRAEVGALLGTPTETASDRWGFGREMILNPLTNEKSGLAVYFTEGTVQGVDYYYGRE